jgi:hypothetical protein
MRLRHALALGPLFAPAALFVACSDVVEQPFQAPALDAQTPDVTQQEPDVRTEPLPEASMPDVLDAETPEPVRPRARFVLLGDFGVDDSNELAVASLVKSWNPDFVVTLGDNNYPTGSAATIDETIGKYYSDFIHPYLGKHGTGATEQRFYPCLGNHDWDTGSPKPHQDYFELPGNERYWEVLKGPVRFFCVDSDPREPDGIKADSVQGKWLEQRLKAATEPHRIVVFHHPAFSSGMHGSTSNLQWPFQAWGATAVYNGHDHNYERFDFGPNTIPYVVQGTGGADLRAMSTSRPGTLFSYTERHGATLAVADDRYVVFSAITVGRDLIDEHVIVGTAEAARATDVLLPAGSSLRYLDTGAAAPGFEQASFDDASWKVGPSPLGYGGGEKTKMATALAHYVRGSFTVQTPAVYDHFVVWMRRDDGAAVYINGVEVARSNLASGALSNQTLAQNVVGFQAESAWLPLSVPSKLVKPGANIIAVELHQASSNSSDAMLDLRVEGKR